MFKISQSNTFTYPVSVDTIIDGGRVQKQNFIATFRRPATEEVTSWKARIVQASSETHEAYTQCQRELAHAVMDGWSDVRDADGNEVPFSTAALTQILDIHPVPFSIANAWIEAVNGGAKAKN